MLCCAASYLSDSESDETGSVSSEEEEHEMHRVVFVSSPEPAWLTRDWRRRLWHARYGTAAYMQAPPHVACFCRQGFLGLLPSVVKLHSSWGLRMEVYQ